MSDSKEPQTEPVSSALVPCSLRDFTLYFLRLGTLGFGGPIALARYMQKDLVEKRRWISKEDYAEGLALAQLAPAPLAAQLAIYLGWVRGGSLGATRIGFAFVLPSFITVLGLAALDLEFGGLTWMRGAFYGIGAAVIAIIARSVQKLVKLTTGKDKLPWALFGLSAIVTGWTESELIWLFIGSGLLTMMVKAPPKFGGAAMSVVPLPSWAVTGLAGAASAGTLWSIGGTSPRLVRSSLVVVWRSCPSYIAGWSGSFIGSPTSSFSTQLRWQ